MCSNSQITWSSRLVFVLLLIGLSGCANRQRWDLAQPADFAADVRSHHDKPAEDDPSLYWDAVDQSSFYLLDNSFDLARQYRKIFGRLREAYNVNPWGGVPNSSWFTNRMGANPLSEEQIRRGPHTIDGPDASGTWTIIRAKTEGVTPGFFVRDPAGEIFILKFDPPDYPELATGAEMVSTTFFYACGYHVPENYLVTFDPAILRIKDGLTFKDRHGDKRPFTGVVLDEVLAKVAHRPDGTIRAIASRFLPGQPLGPFSYHGRRKDDPRDLIPHQHRRELRALRIFAELTNHFDTKDHNSLDIWVETETGGYVKHYLIDFGSTLGSDGDEPKAPYKGYAYVFDAEQALVSLVTLGLRRWSWEGAVAEGMPRAVGYFESERFNPPGWKPLHGNPAFDNMTHADAFWAARIIASFSEDDFRACVAAGEYSDPAAGEYLVRILLERRRKILAYYYQKINVLDQFALTTTDGTLSLAFIDHWVADGLGSTEKLRYRFGRQRKSWDAYQPATSGAKVIDFDQQTLTRMNEIAAGTTDPDEKVFHVQIQAHRNGKWSKWVRVYVYFDGDPTTTRIVGIEREI